MIVIGTHPFKQGLFWWAVPNGINRYPFIYVAVGGIVFKLIQGQEPGVDLRILWEAGRIPSDMSKLEPNAWETRNVT